MNHKAVGLGAALITLVGCGPSVAPPAKPAQVQAQRSPAAPMGAAQPLRPEAVDTAPFDAQACGRGRPPVPPALDHWCAGQGDPRTLALLQQGAVT